MIRKLYPNLKVTGLCELGTKIEELRKAAERVDALVAEIKEMKVAIEYDSLESDTERECECDGGCKRECDGGCECGHGQLAGGSVMQKSTT